MTSARFGKSRGVRRALQSAAIAVGLLVGVGTSGAADIALDLRCVACPHAWQLTLDIVRFLWAEVNALAKGYLNEVHMLAWAYGWREADILAMSSARRQFYLERVG